MMNLKRFEAIVFDLDGTLIDSERPSQDAWIESIAHFGFDISAEDYANHLLGRSVDMSVNYIFTRFNMPCTPDEFMAVADQKWLEAQRRGMPGTQGSHELLTWLDERDYPWAIATASGHQYAQRHVAHMGWKPHALVGGDEVARNKPAPDVYELAALRIGAVAQNCLAIEDSLPGHQSAASAGMTVAAVPHPMMRAVPYPRATHRFDSLVDLHAWLRS